ncbi:SDR family oxidoreductase [Chloroflexota bacterium]
MLAVTGATGQVGGRVAVRLAKLGLEQRLVVRDTTRAPDLPGAEVVQASSYSNAAAMGRALTGVDTLFLVSAHDRMGVTHRSAMEKIGVPSYDRVQEQVTAVAAAAAVGVQRIVYLSCMGAAEDATFVLSHDHFHTEEYIRAIGLPFTFLRMSLYTDRVPHHISDDGVIRGPGGEGRAAWVTRDDLADVAVAALTQSGHEGCTYDVTGPEALTIAESAERLSLVTGRNISYQMQTPHEARTLRTTSGLDKFEAARQAATGTGLSDYDTEVWVSHFAQIANGELATVSDTVPRLTGHEAQSLADYLHTHPESYQHLLTS